MIPFVKYQGLGNDFIVVDNRHEADLMLSSEKVKLICDRRFGVGADGVIFLLVGEQNCDYTMRIFNSDGSEPQMCGNGIRCLARYIYDTIDEDKDRKEKKYKIWTKAGIICSTILTNNLIAVDMGEPVLIPGLIPTTLTKTSLPVIETPLTVAGNVYQVTPVSMGNPHCVIFVNDLEGMNPTFEALGPLVENHVVFPEKVNVEFVQVISSGHVNVKVWERGAGPTLACGTGACATVVAGVLAGKTDRHCQVSLPGGYLTIEWRSSDNYVMMTGPAIKVFSGSIDELMLKSDGEEKQ